MARLSGIEGSVSTGATSGAAAELVGAAAWSIDLESESPDVSGFDGDGWRQFVAGLKSWSGTITLHWDTDATGAESVVDLFDASSPAYGKFNLDDSTYISGDIVINSVRPTNTIDGAPGVEIGFLGSGAPDLSNL